MPCAQALIEGFRTCVWVPLPDGWEEFRDPTTKQPYYVNKATGEKTWTRPEIACARVVATQGGTQQPSQLLPKRQTSIVPQASSGAAAAIAQAAAAAASSATGVANGSATAVAPGPVSSAAEPVRG